MPTKQQSKSIIDAQSPADEKSLELLKHLAKRKIVITNKHAIASLIHDSSRDVAHILGERHDGANVAFITHTLPLAEIQESSRHGGKRKRRFWSKWAPNPFRRILGG
jgi:uncharacterized protein YaiI (UPF0178 family)